MNISFKSFYCLKPLLLILYSSKLLVVSWILPFDSRSLWQNVVQFQSLLWPKSKSQLHYCSWHKIPRTETNAVKNVISIKVYVKQAPLELDIWDSESVSKKRGPKKSELRFAQKSLVTGGNGLHFVRSMLQRLASMVNW